MGLFVFQCLTLLVQHGTDPDYTEELVASELSSRSCVCRQEASCDETCCSPSCDCNQSAAASGSSACNSPVSDDNDNRRGERRHHEPFFLHPPTDLVASLSRPKLIDFGDQKILDQNSNSSSGYSFFLNPLKAENVRLENKKNQSKAQHEPFFLHDPKSIVYTRVRELFSPSTPNAADDIDDDVRSSQDGSRFSETSENQSEDQFQSEDIISDSNSDTNMEMSSDSNSATTTNPNSETITSTSESETGSEPDYTSMSQDDDNNSGNDTVDQSQTQVQNYTKKTKLSIRDTLFIDNRYLYRTRSFSAHPVIRRTTTRRFIHNLYRHRVHLMIMWTVSCIRTR